MGLILLIIQVLVWIVIIDAILTWIPSINRRSPFVIGLRRITEPIYRPIRRLVPPERTGYVDLSPLIVVIGLQILSAILVKFAG